MHFLSYTPFARPLRSFLFTHSIHGRRLYCGFEWLNNGTVVFKILITYRILVFTNSKYVDVFWLGTIGDFCERSSENVSLIPMGWGKHVLYEKSKHTC